MNKCESCDLLRADLAKALDGIAGRDGCILVLESQVQQAGSQRDAALARAEQAEKERDAAIRNYDGERTARKDAEAEVRRVKGERDALVALLTRVRHFANEEGLSMGGLGDDIDDALSPKDGEART